MTQGHGFRRFMLPLGGPPLGLLRPRLLRITHAGTEIEPRCVGRPLALTVRPPAE